MNFNLHFIFLLYLFGFPFFLIINNLCQEYLKDLNYKIIIIIVINIIIIIAI